MLQTSHWIVLDVVGMVLESWILIGHQSVVVIDIESMHMTMIPIVKILNKVGGRACCGGRNRGCTVGLGR